MLLYVDDKEVIGNFHEDVNRLIADIEFTRRIDRGKWLNTVSWLLCHSQQQQTTNNNVLKTDTYMYQQITKPVII